MRNIPRNLIEDAIYCVNYLVYANEQGAQEHLYIAVKTDKMPEFQNAIRQGNFNAEDYGIILEQNKGEAPDNVKERMRILYKCDHESEINVLDYDAEHAEAS